MRTTIWSTTVVVVMGAAAAAAQTPDPNRTGGTQPLPAQFQKLREGRYQIGQMERLLEGAVEHGATVIRDRLQALMPADMLLTENARARGFRLDGYGVFFDVEVPDLGGTLAWSFRTLDQNDLGLDAALRTLRAYVQSVGDDVNLQQAFKRVELQVAPPAAVSLASPSQNNAVSVASQGVADPVQANGSADVAATATAGAAPAPASAPSVPAAAGGASPTPDPVLNNPDEAYRTEIREALIDAMLEHSRGLGIGPDEWLTVAARRTDDRPRLGIDTDARTVVLSVRGSDLTAFLGGQLTAEEARSRIEVRVF
jgi:hypothetical protein